MKALKPNLKHLAIQEFPSNLECQIWHSKLLFSYRFVGGGWETSTFGPIFFYNFLMISYLGHYDAVIFSICDFYVKVRIQPLGRGWGHLWRCAMDWPGGGFSSCGLFTRYFAGWYFLRVFGQYWGFLWRGAYLHPQMSHSRWLCCFYSSILQVLSLC